MKTLLAILSLTVVVGAADLPDASPTPREYLTLIHESGAPAEPSWRAAMDKLAKHGDAFAAEQLKALPNAKLDAEALAIVKNTIAAIQKRTAAENDEAFVKGIRPRLERAALADLGCDPLEGTLVPWALKSIKDNIKRPGVAEELKRIESSYVPADNSESTQARVRAYAKQIMIAPSADKVGGATFR